MPPIRLVMTTAIFFRKVDDVGAVEAVPVGQHDLEPARQRVAEVAVADDRVEVAEVLLVVDGGLGDRPDDELDVGKRCGHAISLPWSDVGRRSPSGHAVPPGRRG